jgi:hypothetical protein
MAALETGVSVGVLVGVSVGTGVSVGVSVGVGVLHAGVVASEVMLRSDSMPSRTAGTEYV